MRVLSKTKGECLNQNQEVLAEYPITSWRTQQWKQRKRKKRISPERHLEHAVQSFAKLLIITLNGAVVVPTARLRKENDNDEHTRADQGNTETDPEK
jgi:hypothetical protein